MEQQVVAEIDELFQELIVEKITKRIKEVNDSLDSLLGEESEIRNRLDQIPSNGGIRSIVSKQLENLNEQAENMASSLNAEEKKLNSMEKQVGIWLLQLAENTKLQIDDAEKHLVDYSETKESSILNSISENALNTENKIKSSLENVQSSISSEISTQTEVLEKQLVALFLDEQGEASFRWHFDSNIQILTEKISECQELLSQINARIGEISTNIVTGNACMKETKNDVSYLVEKSDSFSQKSDNSELLNAIHENASHISAISNTDVLEELKRYKVEADTRLDTFKKINIFLILINVLTLLSVIALSVFK